MDQADSNQFLTRVETLIDSLELVDAATLPASFKRDILEPLKQNTSALVSIRANMELLQWLGSLPNLERFSKKRTWFFWESICHWLTAFLEADYVAVFRCNRKNHLSKIHPLVSEEEQHERQWPDNQTEPFISVREQGFAGALLCRLEGGQNHLALLVCNKRPVPGLRRDRLLLLYKQAALFCQLTVAMLPAVNDTLALDTVTRDDYEVDRGSILGKDPAFLEVLAKVEQAAVSDASVFLNGESGTGKELFARHLHKLSDRNSGPFIAVNCSAIPHELIESEMFGHEKGAFTGAYYRKIGKVEQAHGGVLFLDEIGEMPLTMQAKLLRFLQEKQFTRVGGNQSVRSNARIVTATHRNLKTMVAEKVFREDLFYRINVIPIRIPPLRERGDDIRLLSKFFFQKYISKSRASRRQVEANVFDMLECYAFPGNVRELDNLIQRTVVMVQKPIIEAEDLPEEVLRQTMLGHTADYRIHPFEKLDRFVPKDRDVLRNLKKEVEQISMSYQRDLDRRFLLELLQANDGSARKAAMSANINRTLFYKLLKRAGIDISLLQKGE